MWSMSSDHLTDLPNADPRGREISVFGLLPALVNSGNVGLITAFGNNIQVPSYTSLLCRCFTIAL